MLPLPRTDRRVEAVAALVAGTAAEPLPDADRARIPVIVEALAAGVDADLRRRVLDPLDAASHPELHARVAGPPDGRALLRVLGRATVPPGVAEAALTRAEMFRLAGAVRLAPAELEGPASRERLDLLAAQARRLDRFGEPGLEFDDLAAEAAHALVWTVAAALRAMLQAGGVADADADALAVAAGRARLDGYDEALGLYAAAARLAFDLSTAGALDDGLLGRLSDGGELLALTACLGQRVGLSALAVWPLLAQAGGGRLVLLLRGAGVAREAAARILLRFLHAEDDPLAELEAYDRCEPDEARKALAVLGHDPAYREALRGLGFPS